ncbi:uncharacterized protein BDR25DRAFT_316718 [Lindgomyces ingoldianus]|uniref:Uncharacterized protein n=1 Tax=Lindgomyces ingoldianus TaxID=673940 RepID=A0ACB6QLI3_9PLEO|nr:uncharacterized protein BDR25DRAFT_316718 [Lindgomyces ingoldianus]KAF2467732.1 hypothetical protein BDR25DRAFT_316718 [Lindgomyces ingoldianus]
MDHFEILPPNYGGTTDVAGPAMAMGSIAVLGIVLLWTTLGGTRLPVELPTVPQFWPPPSPSRHPSPHTLLWGINVSADTCPLPTFGDLVEKVEYRSLPAVSTPTSTADLPYDTASTFAFLVPALSILAWSLLLLGLCAWHFDAFGDGKDDDDDDNDNDNETSTHDLLERAWAGLERLDFEMSIRVGVENTLRQQIQQIQDDEKARRIAAVAALPPFLTTNQAASNAYCSRIATLADDDLEGRYLARFAAQEQVIQHLSRHCFGPAPPPNPYFSGRY